MKYSKRQMHLMVTLIPVTFIVTFAFVFFMQRSRLPEALPVNDSYVSGALSGAHFESSWIGVQFDAPDTVEMHTREELDSMMNSQTVNLSIEMYAGSNDAAILITSENMGSSDTTAKEYLEANRQTLLDSAKDGLTFLDNGEISAVQIGGEDYECLKMQYDMDDLSNCSEVYARAKEEHMIIIEIDYNPEKPQLRDSLFDALKPFA